MQRHLAGSYLIMSDISSSDAFVEILTWHISFMQNHHKYFLFILKLIFDYGFLRKIKTKKKWLSWLGNQTSWRQMILMKRIHLHQAKELVKWQPRCAFHYTQSSSRKRWRGSLSPAPFGELFAEIIQSVITQQTRQIFQIKCTLLAGRPYRSLKNKR